MFHKMVNCDTGLHLRSDDTVNMESQPRAKPTQAPNRQTDKSCQASTDHDHLHQGSNMTSRNSYQSLKEIQIPGFSDVEFLTTQPQSQGCSTQAIPCFQQKGLSEDPFFRLVEQYPTQSSLRQDTNDSPGNSQGYTKPNEYVLAKIEGMAENEARQFEEIVTPDFNLLGDADIQRLTEARSLEELHMINQSSLSDALRPRKMLSRANMYVNGDQDILPGCSVPVLNKKPSFSSVLRAKVNSKNRFMHEFNQSNSFDEVSPSSTQISESQQSSFFPGKSIRASYQGPSYVDGSLLDISKTHGLPGTDAGVSHTCVDLGRSILPRCHERRPPLHSISDGRWPDFTNRSSTVTNSLLRRPAFSEHFQSSLLKPPVQRVSIGLAQPLRRDTQQEEVQRGK